MKKVQISVLSLLLVGGLFSNKVSAQEKEEEKVGGFYVDVNLGYNFSSGSQKFETIDPYSINLPNVVTTEETVTKVSLGKGMRFGANVGYLFNANIGAELGVNYLLGGSTSMDKTYSETINLGKINTTFTEELSASMLQFNPSILLTTGNDGFAPYAKFGVVIGVAAKINNSFLAENSEVTSNSVTYSNSSGEMELTGGIALGWSAALGAKYALNETLSLFGELNLINLTYAPTKGVITNYTENGVNQLAGATISETEVEFVDEVTSNSLSTFDINNPTDELKKYYAFSSIGIQVGLKIAF
jgi:hypothetical protein